MSPANLACLWRYVRLGTASALIALSLWALLLPPVFPSSSHAVVNAKAITVRARDGGRVDDLAPLRAAPLNVGQPVVRITREAEVVRREIEEREFIRAKIIEQQASLDAAIALRTERMEAAQSELKNATSTARLALEKTQLAAKEKLRIAREALVEKTALQARVAPLFNEGVITSSQWADTRRETLEAEKNLTDAEAALALLDGRLAAYQRGAGLANEEALEALLARIGTFEQDVGNLRVQRIALEGRLGEVDGQLRSARLRINDDLSYVLPAPISGVVWRRRVVSGETIGPGQDVLDIADTNSIFVEAYFRRDFMNSIALGDRASIYLVGPRRFITGHVADIQVQEKNAREPDVINTLSLDESLLRLTIVVPVGQLQAENIGQLAKVLVSDARGSWPERALVWLSLALRNQR
jgi:multidrug resistance efflux pump